MCTRLIHLQNVVFLHSWSGQNLTLSTIQLNEWTPITSPLLISSFYQLYYNVISLTGLKITLIMTLHLLLSFLHNRIPCKHNAWAANNLVPLDMLLLSNIISLTSPNITLALLFITCFL